MTTLPSKAEAIYGWPLGVPVSVMLNDETVERMCRAHWPTWDRMRADHQRKWRGKMKVALLASWSNVKP